MIVGTTRQVLILFATALMLYSNLWIGSGSFSEAGSEDLVYYAYPTAFSPAPFTFAVWLPIFMGSVALAVFQALPRNRANSQLDLIAAPYLIALLANTAQVFTPLGASNLVVAILFIALAISLARLVRSEGGGAGMTWAVRVPIALFATWAGLATIVNACQWYVATGGSVGTTEAAVLLCLAMAAGIVCVWRTREFAILAVMLWTGMGIYNANSHSTVVAWTVVLTSLVSVVAAYLAGKRAGSAA